MHVTEKEKIFVNSLAQRSNGRSAGHSEDARFDLPPGRNLDTFVHPTLPVFFRRDVCPFSLLSIPREGREMEQTYRELTELDHQSLNRIARTQQMAIIGIYLNTTRRLSTTWLILTRCKFELFIDLH